jgi:hypothetical protein
MGPLKERNHKNYNGTVPFNKSKLLMSSSSSINIHKVFQIRSNVEASLFFVGEFYIRRVFLQAFDRNQPP